MNEEKQREPARQAAERAKDGVAPAAGPRPDHEASPAGYAAMLRANPARAAELLAQLHQTSGNGAVQQVLAELDRHASESKSAGKELPPETRAKMEQSFGTYLSKVRVHEDGAAEREGAEAYASGTDIHFAAGRYNPQSQSGQQLIGHELAHVVQQADGRAPSSQQHKGGVNDDPSLEHEADVAGERAARGEAAGIGAGGALAEASSSSPVQRKATIAPVPSIRKTKLEVLGDGTVAHPGLTIDALETYTTAQLDWFTDPTFAPAEREAVWKVVNLFHYGPHVRRSLAKLHTGEVAALPDRELVKVYTDCFDSSAGSIQLSTPATTLARVLQLGRAMRDLSEFVPGAVLRHVIPESGLQNLIAKAKIPELKTYYDTFNPTLEKPAEWEHVEKLLDEGVKTWSALASWVSELHIFTPATRATLNKNVSDKSRSKPVLLVVMSQLDWNSAFLQGAQLEASLGDPHNLGLVVQGRTLPAVTAQVARVAKDYGKGGKLGQVVMAGHGSDTSMEMSSDNASGWWDGENNRVAYDGQGDVNSKADPKKNGTENLIDTILKNLDPATANIVFAGCLINSHDIDPTKSKLTGAPAEVEKQLRANIKAHPNLADYVRSRMAATGVAAQMSAANASTTFSTFNLDGAGKAQLKDPGDPDVGGTKIGYVRTGIEPEGVLRAAIECCSDAAIGVAQTTAEIRKRVAALAGSTDHWSTCIRVGFSLALPGGPPANVDLSVLADVVHRIRSWSELSADTPAQRLADAVKKSEAATVFNALLAVGLGPDVDALIHQAWMKFDATHATQMMAKLGTAGMNVESFKLQLSRSLVDPYLKTMLPIGGAPTQAQMLLALTIADGDAALPSHVRDFLVNAAGGAASRTFPAALNVDTLIPNGVGNVLERIGLSPKVPPPASGTIDGNVDLDSDGKNETHIEPNPHKAMVKADYLMVRETATSEAKELGKLKKDTIIRVAGSTRNGTWSMIDFEGKVGFVKTMYLQE